MNPKFYITTPIYYPSGKWHLGTCYTTVVCDALARFKRMQGYDVFYLTGTDEHGQKIEKAALSQGVDVKEYVDKQVDSLKKIWDLLGISYDKFIRTTDDYHEKAVRKIFKILYDKGDIYKSEYEGWYCTPCESFWTKTQLVDGKCPDCGREVELTKESSYFFRLSKYQDRLIDLIENNPEFLQPKSRRKEMINNFLKVGLQDLAVSRTSFKWGVKVPFDEEHIIYVWIDALTNYITALGYMGDDDSLFKKFWPADVHMMGKEIIRFHSIIWPALLMALDIPLPKKVYGHGWLLFGNDKISKSKGNIIDPVILSNRYKVDSVRYYLLREIPFGQDGAFTNYAFLSRINADLCNSLGNLLSRSTAMVNQYFDGILPQPSIEEDIDKELKDMANALYEKVVDLNDNLLIPEALSEIWNLINRANKYIDETTPWILARDKQNYGRLGAVLYNLIECLRIAGTLLLPYLPQTGSRILQDIGIGEVKTFEGNTKFGLLKGGERIIKSQPLFPRINIDKELVEMDKIAEQELAKENGINGAQKEEPEKEVKPVIQYEDFAKLDLRVGEVTACEKIKRSQKLLKLTVKMGEEQRTIVSGIASSYACEDLVGKQVIVVANLAPIKFCGVESQGMILCGEDESGNIVIIKPESLLPSGSLVR
ncbi:MAG TPA: methionine--tRNA ligase [Clostridiales bacterium]|mgnify:FL=1|jgi:methionyl-tRNA synthetase|nr:methionine--tRNA ligase [Clostridiales bacterium]